MMPTLDTMTPTNIVSMRQNNPELIVQDCIIEFGLDEQQAERLRLILLSRGVNKWLYARRQFIKLKHEVKCRLKLTTIGTEQYKAYHWVNVRMQNIAKTPRWVEFPKTVTHNFRNIDSKIIIKGRKM